MSLANLFLISYIILIIFFLIASFFIVRHTMHYGYLSDHFKTIVAVFGAASLIVILFSAYLMFQLYTGADPGSSAGAPSGNINY